MSEPTDIDNDEEAFVENTLFDAIENQIESDNPPAAKDVFKKLTLVGYEREEILNLMAHVLAVKGYHYQFVFAKNAGHTDRAVKQQTLPEALEYIWQGYKAK